jgi:hypothetical protein
MTIEQFLELNEMEKLCAIMESGRLMTQKLAPDSRIFLYRLQSFYVSACYCISTDQLTEITAFVDVEETMPHFRKFLISINPAERHYDTPEI